LEESGKNVWQGGANAAYSFVNPSDTVIGDAAEGNGRSVQIILPNYSFRKAGPPESLTVDAE